MGYDVRTVANELIRLAQQTGRNLTNLQLQKLVYIVHGFSLAILHQKLVRQGIEATRYGPMIPILFDALRQYGSGEVTEPIRFRTTEKLSVTERHLVSKVLSAYSRFSGTQLATMTHREGTPWHKVYDPHAYFKNDEIPDSLIEAHYRGLLNEQARISSEQSRDRQTA